MNTTSTAAPALGAIYDNHGRRFVITEVANNEITLGWDGYPDEPAYAIVAASEWAAWIGLFAPAGPVEA